MKYYVVTYGCQMNLSDSERITAVLEGLKYKPAKNIAGADLVVINACSVRQSAIDRIYGVVEKLHKLPTVNRKLQTILTGCVLKKDKKKFEEIFDYIIDIRDIKKLPGLLSVSLRGARRQRGNPESVRKPLDCFAAARNDKNKNYLDIVPKYSNKFSANVPIMTGCNNFCAYCVVPYTREREISRPATDILKEIKNLAKNGCKEIWLLGQNVNSYKNGKTNFPKLLKMVDDISGNFELNFTSSHPKDFSDELIKTMAKCKKLSKRLNLPIQSGDDKILKKMNRPYTVAQYKNLVKKIRRAIPDILLSTDVIVGFPGETKKQFNNTVKTLKEIGFGVAFVNKYSQRYGTVAAKMKDDVSWEEKKRREKILIKLVNE
jgi:tRNA-2-methylthio-N6-dimethylallyladenosine synthase